MKERKKEASKVKQTNKAKQHSTPKAVTFPRKNELPQVGLEPTTLYTLDRALYCTGNILKDVHHCMEKSNDHDQGVVALTIKVFAIEIKIFDQQKNDPLTCDLSRSFDWTHKSS